MPPPAARSDVHSLCDRYGRDWARARSAGGAARVAMERGVDTHRFVASGGKRAVAAAPYINDNVAAKTTRLLPQDRTFEHKCRLALGVRQRLNDSRCGAG